MVEPEVDHDFFELALAVSGAKDLLSRQLHQHEALSLSRGCRWRLGGHPHFGILRGGCRLRALRLAPRHQPGDVIVAREIACAHRHGLEAGESRGHRRIRDRRGIQLAIEVRGESHLLHARDIPGPRTETDPVQHVDDRLVVRPCGNAGRAALGVSGDAGRCQKRNQKNTARDSSSALNTHQ